MEGDKSNVFEIVRNMTIQDLVLLIINNANNQQYIENNNKFDKNKVIFSVNELLIKYPTFTRYSLNKAIKENDLPFFKIGNKRYFEKEAIDNWISNNNLSISAKRKNSKDVWSD